MATPHPTGDGRPSRALPPAACDAHMHLFDPRLPFAEGATLRPGAASAADYRRLQARLGSERCVIVQPSSYGTDHRALVAGLRELDGAARGIAVVTPELGDEDLDTLAAHGVVGARFNLVQRGTTDEGMVGAVAAQARRLGWHLQFHLLPRDLLRLADQLLALPVPVVLDHFARVLAEPGLGPAPWPLLDRLLASGRVWLKLSAPYLGAAEPADLPRLAEAMAARVARHPDRFLWGSDWPHATEPAPKPDDAALLDTIEGCLPGEDARQRVFVDNPAALYRF